MQVVEKEREVRERKKKGAGNGCRVSQ